METKKRSAQFKTLRQTLLACRDSLGGDATINQLIVMSFIGEMAESGEECDVSMVMKMAGLSNAGASRITSNLSDWSWRKSPGLKLIKTTTSHMDRRRHFLEPTAKGTRFLNALAGPLFK